MKRIFFLSIFVLILAVPVTAQTQSLAGHSVLPVKVTADDVMQSTVTSKINAGLRALGDVILVEDDPILRVSIVGIQNTTIGSKRHWIHSFNSRLKVYTEKRRASIV
jgi:hypothetical protein